MTEGSVVHPEDNLSKLSGVPETLAKHTSAEGGGRGVKPYLEPTDFLNHLLVLDFFLYIMTKGALMLAVRGEFIRQTKLIRTQTKVHMLEH